MIAAKKWREEHPEYAENWRREHGISKRVSLRMGHKKRRLLSVQERIDLKAQAIEYSGGKCVDCGKKYYAPNTIYSDRCWQLSPTEPDKTLEAINVYDVFGNADIFEWHHVIFPKRYEGVGDMVSRGRDWNLIKSEIDKCVLLCSNCHKIRHMIERMSPFKKENNFYVNKLCGRVENYPLFKDFLQ